MIGESAGRSKGNRTGDGAVRRNTQRERADIDPVFEPEPPHWSEQLTPLGKRMWDLLAIGSFVVMCVMLALILAAWFGLIG